MDDLEWTIGYAYRKQIEPPSDPIKKNADRLDRLEMAYAANPQLDDAFWSLSRRFAKERGIQPDQFEFQMLYGVRRDLQKSLVAAGYRVRVYIPFGTEWYPYFMRRLAERPANLLFIARNFFRK